MIEKTSKEGEQTQKKQRRNGAAIRMNKAKEQRRKYEDLRNKT